MDAIKSLTLIANPAAQNGEGARAAEVAAEAFVSALGSEHFTMQLTHEPRHAVELAAQLPADCEVVVALGGDGIVHEVVNGLMQRPFDERPLLGVIPVGSGNDYALTLNMDHDIHTAVKQILARSEKLVDVGKCNDEYYVETLSFGLDAAIAIDTMERRVRTGRTGTILYMEAGINQVLRHLNTYHYRAEMFAEPKKRPGYVAVHGEEGPDKTPRISAGDAYIFAVQIGPTYGGHFRICPKADISDGLLDLCIAHPKLNAFTALSLFLLAKNGHHTWARQFEFDRVERLIVTFDEEPPGQIDGEILHGTHFDISCIKQALRVIVGGC